jgi:hypothetical protein
MVHPSQSQEQQEQVAPNRTHYQHQQTASLVFQVLENSDGVIAYPCLVTTLVSTHVSHTQT